MYLSSCPDFVRLLPRPVFPPPPLQHWEEPCRILLCFLTGGVCTLLTFLSVTGCPTEQIGGGGLLDSQLEDTVCYSGNVMMAGALRSHGAHRKEAEAVSPLVSSLFEYVCRLESSINGAENMCHFRAGGSPHPVGGPHNYR